jgi:hypothetical protein
LTTTELPAASAAGTVTDAAFIGTLNGSIIATTP